MRRSLTNFFTEELKHLKLGTTARSNFDVLVCCFSIAPLLLNTDIFLWLKLD